MLPEPCDPSHLRFDLAFLHGGEGQVLVNGAPSGAWEIEDLFGPVLRAVLRMESGEEGLVQIFPTSCPCLLERQEGMAGILRLLEEFRRTMIGRPRGSEQYEEDFRIETPGGELVLDWVPDKIWRNAMKNQVYFGMERSLG